MIDDHEVACDGLYKPFYFLLKTLEERPVSLEEIECTEALKRTANKLQVFQSELVLERSVRSIIEMRWIFVNNIHDIIF